MTCTPTGATRLSHKHTSHPGRAYLEDMRKTACPNGATVMRAESAICLDPPPGGSAEPITLRDRLVYVWKQLLAAPSQLASPLIFDP
jgi:hypothetical protein